MANVRKPIIENHVYGEIIFRLGVHKYYVNKFVEHFTEEDSFMMKSIKPHKEQSVLQRQMEILRKEGYLLTTQIDDEGNKVDKNKKLYYIDFKKIIEVFIDYTISKLEVSKKNKEISDSEYKNSMSKLKNEKWRNKAKTNIIIRYLFSAFIEEVRRWSHDHRKLTLRKLFDAILSSAYLEDPIKYALFDLADEAKMPENIIDESKLIKEDLNSKYLFFNEFLRILTPNRSMNWYINRGFPLEISYKLFHGFEKSDISYYRLKE